MTARTTVHGLQVASSLYHFVQEQVLPGTGISHDAFWQGFGANVADLFRVSHSVWSLGLSAAQLIFDAGATAARVAQAQTARDVRVANYRQTVLAAFQGVEDQLAALRTLAEQEPLRQQAVAAAGRTAQQLLNRYHAGQVSFTDVVNAQAAALAAQRALLQLQVNRQIAVVGLIQALGGGWSGLPLGPDGAAPG